MEEAKGVVKHILLVKFKDDNPQEKIDETMRGYANLVNLIPPMKSFQWGKGVRAENLCQGFTHVLESNLESAEGISDYLVHPAHTEFAKLHLSTLEKYLVFDYKPTTVGL